MRLVVPRAARPQRRRARPIKYERGGETSRRDPPRQPDNADPFKGGNQTHEATVVQTETFLYQSTILHQESIYLELAVRLDLLAASPVTRRRTRRLDERLHIGVSLVISDTNEVVTAYHERHGTSRAIDPGRTVFPPVICNRALRVQVLEDSTASILAKVGGIERGVRHQMGSSSSYLHDMVK